MAKFISAILYAKFFRLVTIDTFSKASSILVKYTKTKFSLFLPHAFFNSHKIRGYT